MAMAAAARAASGAGSLARATPPPRRRRTARRSAGSSPRWRRAPRRAVRPTASRPPRSRSRTGRRRPRRARTARATAGRGRRRLLRRARRRSAPGGGASRFSGMIPAMERDDVERGASAEGEGNSVGEAKWSAIRALEPEFPGIDADDVEFEVLDEGDPEEGRPARVRAVVDESEWEDDNGLPEEPVERLREMLTRVARGFGLRASVEI